MLRRLGGYVIGVVAAALAIAAPAQAAPSTSASTAALPVITSVRPVHGSSIGQPFVVIQGSNFTDVLAVRFGGIAALRVNAVSSTTIGVYAPVHAHGTVPVSVQTRAGTSKPVPAARFIYVHVDGLGIWHAAKSVAPPGQQPTGPGEELGPLFQTTCVTATDCYSIGSFDGGGHAVIRKRTSAGTTAIAAPLPAGTAAGEPSNLTGIACPTTTRCVAVGTYNENPGAGLIETLAGGSWHATVAPVPAGTDLRSLDTVACPTVDTCYATGTVSSGSTAPAILLTLRNGALTAVIVPTPSDWVDPEIVAISCPTATWCEAIGTAYMGASAHEGFVMNVDDGQIVTQPVVNPPGSLWSQSRITPHDITCPAVGQCTFIANADEAVTSGGPERNYSGFWTLQSGHWVVRHVPFPLSGGVARVGQSVFLRSLSCADSGDCVAVGDIEDRGGAGDPLVARLSGTVVNSGEAPMPRGRNPHGAHLSAVSCSSVSSCVAVGSSDDNGLFETYQQGVWTPGLLGPVSGQPTASAAGLSAVTCPAIGRCVADGNYGWDYDPDEGYLYSTAIVAIQFPGS